MREPRLLAFAGLFVVVLLWAYAAAELHQAGHSGWAAAYGALQLFAASGERGWLEAEGTGTGLFRAVAFVAPFVGLGVLAGVVRFLVPWLEWLQRPRSGHAVVVGCGRVGRRWLQGLLTHRRRVGRIVVLDPSPETPPLDAAEARRCSFIAGDGTDAELLRRANAHRARFVVVCTGDDMTNLAVTRAVVALRARQPGGFGRRREPPAILCRIDAPDLLRLVHPREEALGEGVHCFSFFEQVAGRTLEQRAAAPGEGPVHLVVCGFGHFGQTVLDAVAHDPEWRRRIERVTVVDRRADELLEAYRFCARTAPDEVAAFLDERLRARRANLLDRRLWADLAAPGDEARLTVWVCTDNDRTNLTWAKAIRASLAADGGQAVVVCRQTEYEMGEVEDDDVIIASMRTAGVDEAVRERLAEVDPRRR